MRVTIGPPMSDGIDECNGEAADVDGVAANDVEAEAVPDRDAVPDLEDDAVTDLVLDCDADTDRDDESLTGAVMDAEVDAHPISSKPTYQPDCPAQLPHPELPLCPSDHSSKQTNTGGYPELIH